MDTKNTVFCEACKEKDCEVSHDGDCNMIRAYRRYLFLRNADLDSIQKGGIFAGQMPEKFVINGKDLDTEIDKKMYA